MKKLLFLVFPLWIQNSFAVQENSFPFVKVFSVYQDTVLKSGIVLTGTGSVTEVGNRYFVKTNDHLVGGFSYKIIIGEKEYQPKSIIRDPLSDLAWIEIKKPESSEILDVFDKKNDTFCVEQYWTDTVWKIFPDFLTIAAHVGDVSLKTIGNNEVVPIPPWSDKFKNALELTGRMNMSSLTLQEKRESFISDAWLMPGTSGSPVLHEKKKYMPAYCRYEIAGITSQYGRFLPKSIFVSKSTLSDLLKELLEKKISKKNKVFNKNPEIHWVMSNRQTSRESPSFKEMTFAEKPAGIFSSEAGDGSDGDGGDGSDGDGGDGSDGDGGDGSDGDGGNHVGFSIFKNPFTWFHKNIISPTFELYGKKFFSWKKDGLPVLASLASKKEVNISETFFENARREDIFQFMGVTQSPAVKTWISSLGILRFEINATSFVVTLGGETQTVEWSSVDGELLPFLPFLGFGENMDIVVDVSRLFFCDWTGKTGSCLNLPTIRVGRRSAGLFEDFVFFPKTME